MNSTVLESAEELKSKASMLASIHSEEYRLYKFIDALLTLSTLFISIFILAFSFAPVEVFLPDLVITDLFYRAVFSMLAFVAICLSLSVMFFQPSLKASRNREAVIRYSKVKNRIEQKLISSEEFTSEYLIDLQELYLSGEDVPIISDKRFIELKKKYFQKKREGLEIKKSNQTV